MMYAEIKQLSDRYAVDIYPDDLTLEVVHLQEIDESLSELGYITKDEIKIDDYTWHIVLDDRTVNQKSYNGYGLKIDHYKVYEVASVLESGRSKDGKQSFPVPGTTLATKSKQYNSVIVHQNKDEYLIWSPSKQTLDIMRKKVLEWRRNHQFRIERFI